MAHLAPKEGDLKPEEKAKRMAAYAAVDEHVKDFHKVLGIGLVPPSPAPTFRFD
jgi:ribose 5-phosphate isomerase A